jgi:hypothetical protein
VATRTSASRCSWTTWPRRRGAGDKPLICLVDDEDDHARALLDSSLAAPLDVRVRDLIIAETRGNPLALLQLAAADPSGDRALVLRAAERLGIGARAGAPAEEAGLVEFSSHVRFRHPLTRSAAYRSASLAERQQLHAALAEVTDP